MLITPPAPRHIPCDNLYDVSVRALPDGQWQPVATYAAQIDMHHVTQCAAAIFDFTGSVEVKVKPHFIWVNSVVIRPLSLGIEAVCLDHEFTFVLNEPHDLMIEVNNERFRALHLFAGAPFEEPTENVLYLDASRPGPHTAPVRGLKARLEAMPEGRTLVFGPGFHVIEEYTMPIPAHTQVYFAPGAVALGGLVVEDVEDVRIYGHGVLFQQGVHRFSGTNGVRVSHSSNVAIEGLTFINPAHYTVLLGDAQDVLLRGLRSFSCEGWSDGLDMMSCQRVHIDRCFLRTSDDCITVYGSRWDYYGDSRDVLVENCTLWADVAHPINIGAHGDHAREGDIIENLTFRSIDILEHHEPQPGYLGCMALGVGDKNTVRNVLFEDIRVEHIEYGKLLDIKIVHNPMYNPCSGRLVENITFRNIRCGCIPPVASVIDGFDEDHPVRHVTLENVTVCGQPPEVAVGPFASDVRIIP